MVLKAVFFDLHDTLVYLDNPLSSEEVSEFLLAKGYEVYPQSWDAASHFVGMVDDPKHGYKNRQDFLKQVLNRLDVKIDNETLKRLAQLHEDRNKYSLFPDAAPAVKKAKQLNLKTAIVTTIPDFIFRSAIVSIRDCFDTIMTGYRAGCEKSDPEMHRRTLQSLGVGAQEAAMIGDELLVDIKIPKKLGMRTILLDRANRIKSKPEEADAKANTLTEAVAIIEKWQKP
jgi:HAD superfamily hydrolase (TIGR01549 family)